MEKTENETRVVLAANIKALVAGRGIGALAKTIGIGTGTLQRAVSGDGAVRVDTLGKLAEYFGVEVRQLFMPNLGQTGMPFKDLDAFESQLVGMFRRLTHDQQQHLLNKVNKAVNHAEASPTPSAANPFPSAARSGPSPDDAFGESGLGELDPPPRNARS